MPAPIILETLVIPSRINQNQSTCENGGFEQGSYSSGYSTYIASRSYLENASASSYQQIYIPDRHGLVTSGYDPIVGNNLLPMVYEGNYAVKIGKSDIGNGAATNMRYEFIVDQSNANFRA